MYNQVLETLNPNNRTELLWTPDQDGFVYPEAVNLVSRRFNNTDFDDLVDTADAQVNRDKTTGIEYALWQMPGDSETDAIVMFSTFATRIDRNMALRGKFCDSVFRASDIVDAQGRPLPLVFFGAPAGSATYPLSREQRSQVNSGDLGPAAAAQMAIMRQKGFGRLALMGFSQGGSMAAAGARVAHEEGLDISAVGAASVPNVKERGAIALQLAFVAQAQNLRPDLDRGGLKPFQQVHAEDYSELKYTLAMLSQFRMNWVLFKGMTHNNFGDDLDQAMQHFPSIRTTISVASGELDSVGIEPETRTTLEDLRHDAELHSAPIPHFVSIKGGKHSWGDRVKLLSSFYAYALARIS